MFDSKKEIWADKQLSNDVDLLVEKSPDLAVDMAVLMWIFVKRDWRPPFKGWARLPADWFGQRSHMGFRRVVESANRLESLGIIQKMAEEGKRHCAMRYKYARRNEEYESWFNKKRESLPDVEQSKTDNADYEKVNGEGRNEVKVEKQVLKVAPTVGRVLHWTGSALKYQECSVEEMNASPICPICHKHFLATEAAQRQTSETAWGVWLTDDGKPTCIICGLKRSLNKAGVYPRVNNKVLWSDEVVKDLLAREKSD